MSKKVLITGAANGLGYELSLLFGKAGYEILALDRDANGLNRLQSFFSKNDWALQTFEVDLSNLINLEDFLNSFDEQIDCLVNNAGFVSGGNFHEQSIQEIQTSFFVNTLSPLRLMQFFVKKNLHAKQPLRILNIISVSALLGFNGASIYGSSKWALMGASEALFREYKSPKNLIQINVAAPSYIDTGMFQGARPPLLTKFLQPKPLALDIFRAFQRNQFLLIRPRILYLIPYLKTLFGFHIWNRILDFLRMDEGMKNWTGKKGSQ